MVRFRYFSVLLVLAFLLAACGPSGVSPDESGELMVIQIDDEGGMRFNPDNIVLTAGQRVRIILENQGEKDHEFMIGQNVIRMDDGAANGFEVDFFADISDLVEVQLGDMAMLMIDGETVDQGVGDMAGMDHGDGGDEMEGMDHGDGGMDHLGWMVMNPSGSGITIIEFTVPESLVGEWEMGCFEDDGAHYDDGMRGTLTVTN